MNKFFEAVGLLVVAVVMLAFLSVLGAYPTKWVVNYLFAPGVSHVRIRRSKDHVLASIGVELRHCNVIQKYEHGEGVDTEDAVAKIKTKSERFFFVEDDDGHWYQIPESKRREFSIWLEAGPYWDSYYGPTFDDARLDCHISCYSFENVKEVLF